MSNHPPAWTSIVVTEFGARGDGEADDTAAVQSAIDAAAARGGGTVVVPAGVYPVAHLRLRSNTTLRIESAASVVNVPTESAPYFVDSSAPHPETRLGWIVATDAQDVAIEGGGVIDGRGADFQADHRPIALKFLDCSGVRIADVRLRQSPSWMVHLARCEGVFVTGVDIWSHCQINNDGIDIDSCAGVTIANSAIDCGDDAIAMKTTSERPTRDVIVTGCRLRSEWAAIRIGPESKGDFSNICVAGCVVSRAWGTAIKLQMCEGAAIRNVVFSSIAMSDVTGPFMIRLSGWSEGAYAPDDNVRWREGSIEDVLFTDIVAAVTAEVDREPNWPEERFSASSISGLPGMEVKRISFSGLTIVCPGNGQAHHAGPADVPELPERYPEYIMFGVLPAYGFFIRHADQLRFQDVRLVGGTSDSRRAFVLHRVRRSRFTDISADGAEVEIDG